MCAEKGLAAGAGEIKCALRGAAERGARGATGNHAEAYPFRRFVLKQRGSLLDFV